MVRGHGSRNPHPEGTTVADQLHQRCEQVAVPNFDWFNKTVVAIVDGLLHIPPPTDDPLPQIRSTRRR
jgi:hypothetical protein